MTTMPIDYELEEEKNPGSTGDAATPEELHEIFSKDEDSEDVEVLD